MKAHRLAILCVHTIIQVDPAPRSTSLPLICAAEIRRCLGSPHLLTCPMMLSSLAIRCFVISGAESAQRAQKKKRSDHRHRSAGRSDCLCPFRSPLMVWVVPGLYLRHARLIKRRRCWRRGARRRCLSTLAWFSDGLTDRLTPACASLFFWHGTPVIGLHRRTICADEAPTSLA